jgi:hypothetical protein
MRGPRARRQRRHVEEAIEGPAPPCREEPLAPRIRCYPTVPIRPTSRCDPAKPLSLVAGRSFARWARRRAGASSLLSAIAVVCAAQDVREAQPHSFELTLMVGDCALMARTSLIESPCRGKHRSGQRARGADWRAPRRQVSPRRRLGGRARGPWPITRCSVPGAALGTPRSCLGSRSEGPRPGREDGIAARLSRGCGEGSRRRPRPATRTRGARTAPAWRHRRGSR